MKPDIIGLYSSTMQSGKSEVAKRLVEEHGYTLVKFAHPLKAMARAFLRVMRFDSGTIERMLEGDLKEKFIPALENTPRELLQTIGTEWGRDTVADDLWVRVAMQSSRAVIEIGGRVVIDDLRFPNEFQAIRKVSNSSLVIVERPGAQVYRDHPSEGLLDDMLFDVKLLNDDTLEVLKQAVDIYIAAMEANIKENAL